MMGATLVRFPGLGLDALFPAFFLALLDRGRGTLARGGAGDALARAKAVVALLSPALVVTQTFGADGRLAFDERAVGGAVVATAPLRAIG